MKRLAVLFIGCICIAGCSMIDDDLSVCGIDYEMLYEMQLVTNVQMTVDEKLSLETEQVIADTLKRWLEPIFSGHAHDLNMNFYAADGEMELRQHRFEIVDATQKSYTLYIPRENYMHLAIVNTDDNTNMSIQGEPYASSLGLSQLKSDTLPSHQTAVYTARLPMQMQAEGDQSFYVNLYMISCAVALVITEPSFPIPPIEMYLNGTATGFQVLDSVFSYNHPSLIRAEKVVDQCYAVIGLPSPDSVLTPVPFRRSVQSDGLWQLRAYVTMPDNTVTETVLSVDYPLRAGAIEIIKVEMKEDGSLTPLQTNHVGATVTLDWKEGSSHEVEI